MSEQRSRSSKILFWVAFAPTLFYGTLMASVALPSLFVGPSAAPDLPPLFRLAFDAYAYVAAGLSAVLVWWCWRVFCGDSLTAPKLASRKAVLWALLAVALWVAPIVLLDLYGTANSDA